MRIVIPTRGRVGRQTTLRWLGPRLRSQTTIVCPLSETDRHRREWPEVEVVAQPGDDWWIGTKRAWILERESHLGSDRLLMLDDDLGFFYRAVPDDPASLRTISRAPDPAGVLEHYLQEWWELLSPDVPHAGLGPKMNNNTRPGGWHGPGRTMYALGYHLPTLFAAGVSLDRVQHREDMDVALQLLSAGYDNRVCHTLVVSPATYGQPGGCSEQRTVASSDADAYRLAELHPGLVRVGQRSYRGTPRLEVSCSWRRALDAGKLRRAGAAGGIQEG